MWLAMLAVLTLLTSPVLAGRAHAAMVSAGPTPMAMPGMAGGRGLSAACHHEGSAACSVACSLAAQLLPPQVCGAEPPMTSVSRVEYAEPARGFAGVLPQRGVPPPR